MSGEIVLVIARARNGAIGSDGRLPWHLPADLRHFKALTMGRPMVMGRRTFESLPGLLPGRRHIVLTRDRDWSAQGAYRAGSVEEALAFARDGEDGRDLAIIGGAQIYALFAPVATRIELTEIHRDYAGDTYMPPFGPEWRETHRQEFPADGDKPAYAFVTLVRDV